MVFALQETLLMYEPVLPGTSSNLFAQSGTLTCSAHDDTQFKVEASREGRGPKASPVPLDIDWISHPRCFSRSYEGDHAGGLSYTESHRGDYVVFNIHLLSPAPTSDFEVVTEREKTRAAQLIYRYYARKSESMPVDRLAE